MEQLSSKDKLRRNLLAHFVTPYMQDEKRVDDLRQLCESDFEREVYDILTERGYRVQPQVKVGQYRIDMVVEGDNDTRLAIECDGDQYHGPDRWEDDIHRQRILERVGWQFWRCFASTFVKNKKEVIAELLEALTERNIEPIGAESSLRSIHTETRFVKGMPHPEKLDQLDRNFLLELPSPTSYAPPSKENTLAQIIGLIEHPKFEKNGVTQNDIIEFQFSNSSPQQRLPIIVPLEQPSISKSSNKLVNHKGIAIGDTVLLSFLDGAFKERTYTISASSNDPNNNIILHSTPIAKALLGAEEEEEVEVPYGAFMRVVKIEAIQKP